MCGFFGRMGGILDSYYERARGPGLERRGLVRFCETAVTALDSLVKMSISSVDNGFSLCPVCICFVVSHRMSALRIFLYDAIGFYLFTVHSECLQYQPSPVYCRQIAPPT